MLQVDMDILYAATYLHDLGAFPPYQQPKIDHAVRSVEICPEILEKVHGPIAKIHQIQQVIRYHMFSTSLPELTGEKFPSEVWVFRDADILEFLGFIGISRLLAVAGLDDWVPTKESASALIHKFQHDLPPLLHFNSAQRLGQVRIQEIDRYFTIRS
jgi:uncharacterized protein